MGFSWYFYTKRNDSDPLSLVEEFEIEEGDPRLMTIEEVKAGVMAIKEVAERRSDEFNITRLGDTEIVVVATRAGDPIEGIHFCPRAIAGGYVVNFGSCKTNKAPEDAGVAVMLRALGAAVNGKLWIHNSDDEVEDG